MAPDADDRRWKEVPGDGRKPRRTCYIKYRGGFIPAYTVQPSKRNWSWAGDAYDYDIVAYIPATQDDGS